MNIKRANFLIGTKLERDMAYNLKPLPTFDQSLNKLDKNIARRVIEKLDRLAENPTFYILYNIATRFTNGYIEKNNMKKYKRCHGL